MRILSDGKIGIGTDSPASELHISSSAPVITGTATNNNSGLRVNVVGGGNELFRVQDGGTTRFQIDGSGHVTKPSQPAVLVTKSTSTLNMAANTTVTHTWDSEVFDVGGDFASNTFTAPVTGKYLVTLQMRWQNIPTNFNYIQTYLATSNGTRYMGLFGSGTDIFNAEVDYYRDGQSLIIDMDANDTFDVRSYQSAGSATVDIGTESYLSVALLG